MSCCRSCDEGKSCEGSAEPAGATAPASQIEADLQVPTPVLIPGTVQVAERLGLAESEVTASKAVSIEGSNAVRVDVLVVNLTLSAVTFRIQVSNDSVCWSDAALFKRSTSGYATAKVRGIGFRFVRLYYEASNTAGGEGVLAASLHHWRN